MQSTPHQESRKSLACQRSARLSYLLGIKMGAAALAGALVLGGCSSSSSSVADPGAKPAPDAGDPGQGDAGATAEEDAAPADKCGAAPKKSYCDSESSWVRGIAHFDPSHFKPGSKPVLRVILRHGFVLVKGEETIGGRLHSYTSVPVTDPSKGEIPFAVDMCGLGTAMWSEENGTFHLVLIMDEDGNNDLDDATSNENAVVVGTPGATELAKMVDVDVSCHAPSPCLDVNIDCKGVACTTITPLESCKKKTPRCESDSVFCR